jgi:hypothetical protein
VAEGVASVVGINVAISAGPELCGASMGPYLTFHLAGRASGIDHFIDQFAAPMGAGGNIFRMQVLPWWLHFPSIKKEAARRQAF